MQSREISDGSRPGTKAVAIERVHTDLCTQARWRAGAYA